MAELKIDCSLILEAYNLGIEQGFIIATEFKELDSELNQNNIDDAEEKE